MGVAVGVGVTMGVVSGEREGVINLAKTFQDIKTVFGDEYVK